MGSIPLAANNLKVPEQPNALEQYARIMQIKGEQQRQALMPGQLQQQKQQLQAGDLENQTRQMDINSQKALMRAYEESGGNLDKAVPLAAKYGAKPDAVIKLREASMNQQKQNIELLNAKGARAIQEADLMQGAHDKVAAAKPEDRPGLYQQQLAGLQQAGVDISQAPPQYPGDEQFKVFGIGIKGHKQQLEDLFKESEAREKNAQAAKLEQETKYTSGPAAEGRYRFVLAKLAAKQPVAQEDLDFARGFEASNAKTTSQSDSLGVTSTNTSRPSGLSMVGGKGAPVQGGGGAQPTGNVKNSIVDMIGQYKDDPTHMSRLIAKHPDILAAVQQKYPDWSQPNYNAANKAITDLAPSGKTGQQITSYNTFLRHAGALYDAVNSLDNSKYGDLVNKPLNWLAQHTGDPRVADFMAAMQPPMKEFQSFLLNNHAMHEEDVKDAHALIDQNKTPQEIKAVLNRFAETGSARLSEQNESFKRVTGRDIPNLVSPQAAAAYNKITSKGGGGAHVIKIGDKQYQYKGKGDTADLNNYTPIQ